MYRLPATLAHLHSNRSHPNEHKSLHQGHTTITATMTTHPPPIPFPLTT